MSDPFSLPLGNGFPIIVELLTGLPGVPGPQGEQGPQGEPGISGGISEVNGYTGPIVSLTATDVGAISGTNAVLTGTCTLNGNEILTQNQQILGGNY
jgi:hypothetical protein